MSGSWVSGADGSGFGIENLPYGVLRRPGERPWPAVRIGQYALDLTGLGRAGLLQVPSGTFEHQTLNRFIELGPAGWSATRARLTELLSTGSPYAPRVEPHLVPLEELQPVLPVEVRDYVDFYASIEHATNLGRMFRPDAEPLMPNWRHLPVGYHGRAGTVVVSGTPIRRPCGQRAPDEPGNLPSFGPERRLDIELELGFITGPGPALGAPIPISAAAEHIFGFVLVNDWSAREIQRWEYQPLGPFLGKSFATSISPWVVPLDALASARVPGPTQEPTPLEYLCAAEPWSLDIDLEASLLPAGAQVETTITRTNARGLYWNAAQQLAHATTNGATVAAGDLFASGTISGPEPATYGSLIELTWAGQHPLTLNGSAERTFLLDGDTIIIRGRAGDISLGEVQGRIEPAGEEQAHAQLLAL